MACVLFFESRLAKTGNDNANTAEMPLYMPNNIPTQLPAS